MNFIVESDKENTIINKRNKNFLKLLFIFLPWYLCTFVRSVVLAEVCVDAIQKHKTCIDNTSSAIAPKIKGEDVKMIGVYQVHVHS